MNKSRFCFKCSKKIEPIKPELHDSPESGMWNDGIVDKIAAGYGSSLDGDIYIIAICDNCIKESRNTDRIEYIGYHVFGKE